MSGNQRFAAVEAGGTKFICALADQHGAILEQATFPTRSPFETFADLKFFFANANKRHGAPTAAGVASFGPVELDPASPSYGHIGGTPKVGWTGADILGAVAEAAGAPVRLDTDVNGAALGEGSYGGARDVEDFAYVTVGTGIGVGIVLGGDVRTVHPHTEMGHIRVARADGDMFQGNCPFHGDCLEGLASGPAMRARWGAAAETLTPDHPAWTFASHYLAALCVNLTYSLRLQRIILGGGVMSAPSLLERVRADFARMMAGYALGERAANPETFIVTPLLENPSPALAGAIELARQAAAAAESD